MPNHIYCPNCQRALRLSPEQYGSVQCPSCHTQFNAGTTEAFAAAAPGAMPPPPVVPDCLPWTEPAARPVQRLVPPARKKSGAGGIVLVLLIVGLASLAVVGGLGLIVAVTWKSMPPTTAPIAQGTAQNLQDVRDAFGGQKGLGAAELVPELKPLFEELGAAFRAGDGERLVSQFDLDRVFDELKATQILPREMNNRRAFIAGMRSGMSNSLAKQAPLLAWDRFEFRNIKKLDDSNAVVIVRHHVRDGQVLKMRWWLTRSAGTWKVYDLEDLDVSIRLSTGAAAGAALAAEGQKKLNELMRFTNTLREALTALNDNDVDTAEKKLASIESIKISPQIDAVRLFLKGMIQIHRESPRDALASFARAEKLHPDMPCLALGRGLAYNALSEWKDALEHLEAYHDLLGDDANVCVALGAAFKGLDRLPEAQKSFRACLDLDQKNGDAFLGLVESLRAQDDRSDLAERFLRLDEQQANFEACAENCKERQDSATLVILAEAMRKAAPTYAAADYYLALARDWEGMSEESLPLFRTAIAKEKDRDKKREYFTDFMHAAANSGKALEVYAEVKGTPEAFQHLAASLKEGFQPDELKPLVLAHAKKHPNDPLLPFYQAEVYLSEENYAAAYEAFARGMTRPPEADTLETFRWGRLQAMYHTGRAVAAYSSMEPKEQTFQQLASLAWQNENLAVLGDLIAARAKDAPKDPELARQQVRLMIKQNQVKQAIARFKAAGREEQGQYQQLLYAFLSAMVEAGAALEGYQAAPDANEAFQIVARELFNHGRYDELRRLIEAHRQKQPDDYWSAYYRAQLQSNKKEWDKAVTEFSDFNKRATEEERTGQRWQYIYVAYKAGNGLSAYRDSPDQARNGAFQQLANLMVIDHKGEELQALIEAHRPHAEDSADLFYFEARAKILQKKPDQAVPLIQKACAKAEEFQRGEYVRNFVTDMEAAGQPLEAYRAVPDKHAAFQTLAQQLVFKKNDKVLAELVALHGKTEPGNSLVRYYQGEVHLLRGEIEPATNDFIAALANATRSDQWQCRDGLIRARIKAGKVVAAYRELGPGPRSFERVACVCLNEKDAGQLQAVIAERRQSEPDDPNLPVWELEVCWLRADYEGALKLLAKHRQGVFALVRNRLKCNDYLVRSLIKLKRLDEALREAEALVKTKKATEVLLVLAHAARGEVKQSIAVVDKVRAQRSLLWQCYKHADLGPLLQTDAFAEFRTKYPEPTDNLDDSDD